MHLQQLIITWWKFELLPQLQGVMRAMPTINMWTIWKRRSSIKHDETQLLEGW